MDGTGGRRWTALGEGDGKVEEGGEGGLALGRVGGEGEELPGEGLPQLALHMQPELRLPVITIHL